MKRNITLLILLLGIITKTNAQCEPFAGNDGGICGLNTTLYAQLSTDSSTCQWVVASTPAGGSATIINENNAITDIIVNVFGVYEFKLIETNGSCTGVDIVSKEFVRIPNGAAGLDQNICGEWAELNAYADTYPDVEMGWLQAPVTWVDTIGSVNANPSSRLLPHSYVYNTNLTPEHCSDTVQFVWQQYCSGIQYPTTHCVATDTLMVVFSSKVFAEEQTNVPSEVCGKYVELNAIQTQTTCNNVSGYWIDAINYTINWWTDTTHTIQGNGSHTVAENLNYHQNSYAYVVQSGACTDTSNFQDVTFIDCDATNIKEIETDNTIVVYPNPAKNSLTINTKHNKGTIQIYDVYGRVVTSYKVNGKLTYTINISKLNSGIYFIKIGNQTAKFIKE